jgi:hypothetical protein
MKIDLVADLDDIGEKVHIRALLGGIGSPNPTIVELTSVTVKPNDDLEEAVARGVESLFWPTDLAEKAELDELRDDYNRHSHGQPNA